MKTIILGAGMTGMAAGIKTGAQIFEATDHAGGICTSYMKDGFEFSHGGPHFLFGKGPGLDFIKTLVDVKEYERRAGVYFNHTFPYPFQTNALAPITANAGSLKQWLVDKFGVEQCNLFFHPFNEKYSAGLYDEVIQADEFKSPPAGSVGFIPTFGDPVGGLITLVQRMSEQCRINYNKIAVKIDLDRKAVAFSDGTAERYDRLISTIPLRALLHICGKKDIDLPFSSVLVLNIGAERAVKTPNEHWLYVPFCTSAFHRLCFYSNVDASKAPEGKVAMAVEIAFSPEFDESDMDMPFIIKNVTDELKSWNIIGDVITVDPTYVRTAYTWLKSLEDRTAALAWLKQYDIFSTGRYGKWSFQGMVQSVEDGLNVEVHK